MSRLFILAGTYQQAVHAARDLPSDTRWRYVGEPRHLLGIHDEPFIVVGTFYERRDAAELLALTRMNRMRRGADTGGPGETIIGLQEAARGPNRSFSYDRDALRAMQSDPNRCYDGNCDLYGTEHTHRPGDTGGESS